VPLGSASTSEGSSGTAHLGDTASPGLACLRDWIGASGGSRSSFWESGIAGRSNQAASGQRAPVVAGWAEVSDWERSLDRWQRDHGPAGFVFAIFRKYSEDQVGYVATAIAYYAFFSIFPLLLLFTTVLGSSDLRRVIHLGSRE
jgi:hypothetical protein